MRADEQKPDTRREGRASGPVIAKPISIKDAKRRFGGAARKAVELTSGDLRVAAPESGLGKSRGNPNAAQKSAEGVVGREPEGPNGMEGK